MRKISTTFLLSVLLLIAGMGGLTNCQKETKKVYVIPDSTYTGQIQFILKYNPSQFGIFYKILEKDGLANQLSTPGPWTALTISNDYLASWTEDISRLADYVIPKSIVFGQMKPGDEIRIDCPDGYKIFCNAYQYGNSTRCTVNGTVILVADQKTSNGYINMLYGGMPYIWYNSCLDFINGQSSLTTFAYALKRAHLDTMLADTAAKYTVLFIGNDVFAGRGIGIDSISRMEPDSVAAMISHNILKGRYHAYDIISQYHGDGAAADTVRVPTMADSPMKAVIIPNGTDMKDYYVQFVGSNTATGYFAVYSERYLGGAGLLYGVGDLIQP